MPKQCRPKSNRCLSWFFTKNNPDLECLPALKTFLSKCEQHVSAVFQLERGNGQDEGGGGPAPEQGLRPRSDVRRTRSRVQDEVRQLRSPPQCGVADAGTEHYQGCIKFRSGRKFEAVVQWCSFLDGAHWERCKNWKASVNYCSKEDSRIQGPWYFGSETSPRKEPTDYFVIGKASPWQETVLQIVRGTPDARKIHWVWSETGGVGKSTLARHLVGFRYRGRAILVRGGVGDIHYGVKALLDDGANLHLVVIDIPRANDNHVSYQALEDLKNGMLFSSKYESGMAVFDRPHVLVFCNQAPERGKLSADRWDVHHIAALQVEHHVAQPLPQSPVDLTCYESFDPMNLLL